MTFSPVAYIRKKKKWLSEKIYGPEVVSWPEEPFPCIDLTFWRPKKSINFGDDLSRIIVGAMLARRKYTFFDEISAPRHMIAIGSTLHFAQNGTIVWGSGANVSHLKREYQFKTLDVRAVRGPKTAAFLNSMGIPVPEIYGDPGLLLPHLFGERFKRRPKLPVAFVPNLNDKIHLSSIPALDIPVIDPMRSWNRCVQDILDCEFIIASSLHALVVAEAWGIPARYVRLTDHEGLFKYEDYYMGSGRETFMYAKSIAEAVEMGGERPLANFDARALMGAFPYDVWESPLEQN